MTGNPVLLFIDIQPDLYHGGRPAVLDKSPCRSVSPARSDVDRALIAMQHAGVALSSSAALL